MVDLALALSSLALVLWLAVVAAIVVGARKARGMLGDMAAPRFPASGPRVPPA